MYPTRTINNLINVIDYEKLIQQQSNIKNENFNQNVEVPKENSTSKTKVLTKRR